MEIPAPKQVCTEPGVWLIRDQPTAIAKGTIDGVDVAAVWELIAPFNTLPDWWLGTYSNFKCDKDDIGEHRSFNLVNADNMYVTETLVGRDHQTHCFRYDAVDAPFSVATIVSLKQVGRSTEVTWQSWTKSDNKEIFSKQQHGYKCGIEQIQRHFKEFPPQSGYCFHFQFAKNLVEGARKVETNTQRTFAVLEGVSIVQAKLETIFKALVDADAQDATKPWEYSDIDATTFPNLPRIVKELPKSEILPPQKVALMLQSITEFVMTVVKPFYTKQLDPNKVSGEMYKRYFNQGIGDNVVKLPELLKNNVWRTDDEFCTQLLQGVNPLMLRVVCNIDDIPKSMAESKEMNEAGIVSLVKEQRLYMISYPKLFEGLENEKNGNYFYFPTLLVYRDDAGTKLSVLGIQLEEGGHIYQPGSKFPNRYLLAKVHFACADNQYHQFVLHLGFAHLATAPLAIASHNALERTGHPLGAFLKPHFRDTLGINYLALQTLVAKDKPITDTTFSAGTEQGVKMVDHAFKEYNFMASGLEEELKRRGFGRPGTDGLKAYRYRDDGFLIWDALTAYCGAMVDELYPTDEDVRNDEVLQSWATECASKAKIKGFPATLDSKKQLTTCLTTIIWTASALHSVLNYTQYPFCATPINRPAAMKGKMPEENGKDIDMDHIYHQAQHQATFFQMALSWLLSTPEPPTLDVIARPDSVVMAGQEEETAAFKSFAAEHRRVYDTLKAQLDEAKKTIEERNKTKPVYNVLLPSQVAASINI
eukprot:TRINITY_DN3011_c0_g1_i1.p1 TRINITY_DN3011_c0_g1~~TRINITY_DN3011_c0_g1_i1.p1  ORF type:complete len:760 (+),score=139.19 TRINITY_DN3011_c0_g1_i1:63-2342(+)